MNWGLTVKADHLSRGTIELDIKELLGFSQVAKVSETARPPSAELGRLLSKISESAAPNRIRPNAGQEIRKPSD
jgi:hypothetical protein